MKSIWAVLCMDGVMLLVAGVALWLFRENGKVLPVVVAAIGFVLIVAGGVLRHVTTGRSGPAQGRPAPPSQRSDNETA